jgi:large subunit ribosomal protein L19
MDKIKLVEQQYVKKELPKINVGDTVKVISRIFEADKMRLHTFEGLVIAKKDSGIRSSITVRKISYSEGVERVFPVYSPNVEKIEVVKRGKPRRAKLYYLRKRIGKRATEV